MSMSQNLSMPTANVQNLPQSGWASALARYTRERRQQLGLTVPRAAELSGLEVSEWYALEDGWAPSSTAVTRAIAATLEVRWEDYDLLAFFTRCGQRRPA